MIDISVKVYMAQWNKVMYTMTPNARALAAAVRDGVPRHVNCNRLITCPAATDFRNIEGIEMSAKGERITGYRSETNNTDQLTEGT
jgi:hypothetical protein